MQQLGYFYSINKIICVGTAPQGIGSLSTNRCVFSLSLSFFLILMEIFLFWHCGKKEPTLGFAVCMADSHTAHTSITVPTIPKCYLCYFCRKLGYFVEPLSSPRWKLCPSDLQPPSFPSIPGTFVIVGGTSHKNSRTYEELGIGD